VTLPIKDIKRMDGHGSSLDPTFTNNMSGLSRPSIEIATGIILGFAMSSCLWTLWDLWRSTSSSSTVPKRTGSITDGVTELIGASVCIAF
jgi:hypothetical protein